MKKIISTTVILFLIGFAACTSDAQKEREKRIEEKKIEKESLAPASERITLDNKGVGPIKSLELPASIDEEMVARGMELFKTNCSACHKTDKKFVGPSPQGIMKRRSPEWIMNMILDPQLMVEQDRLAKDLLIEFNGAAMANQNVTEEQARDILEYFRTLN